MEPDDADKDAEVSAELLRQVAARDAVHGCEWADVCVCRGTRAVRCPFASAAFGDV